MIFAPSSSLEVADQFAWLKANLAQLPPAAPTSPPSSFSFRCNTFGMMMVKRGWVAVAAAVLEGRGLIWRDDVSGGGSARSATREVGHPRWPGSHSRHRVCVCVRVCTFPFFQLSPTSAKRNSIEKNARQISKCWIIRLRKKMLFPFSSVLFIAWLESLGSVGLEGLRLTEFFFVCLFFSR